MKFKIAILLIVSSTIFVACYKTPTYPDIPAIEFDSYNVINPYQALAAGSMFLKFTDGDGDLGLTSTNDTINVNSIFIRTIKFNKEDTSNIPFIPKKGTSNAISGTIEVKLYGKTANSGGLIDESDILILQKPLDTLVFSIYIKDRTGHSSNVVTTPPLVIKSN